jgi:hypothetical protein
MFRPGEVSFLNLSEAKGKMADVAVLSLSVRPGTPRSRNTSFYLQRSGFSKPNKTEEEVAS